MCTLQSLTYTAQTHLGINFMLTKSAALLTLALIASPFANAFTVVSTEVTKGTVTNVDATTNTISLEAKDDTNSVALTDNARIILEGKNGASISDIKQGHKIKIKRRIVQNALRKIEGKVLSVDHESYTAKVRQTNTREVVEVRFSKNVKVLGETNLFTDIAAGQHISLKYVN